VVETDGGQIPKSAWWPETSLEIGNGQTRAVEFVAEQEGDWPLHCHKTHHAMNAMSHGIPNVIGVDQSRLQQKLNELAPGSMAMGSTGMTEHSEHQQHLDPLPNTLPMMTGAGPFGSIDMGGMFTVMKIRANLASYDKDPGWFDHPPGTVAFPVKV
jgi:hypothetical protein